MTTTMTVGEALSRHDTMERDASGVSWAAIVAGAAAAAALSLVLLVLGTGLGLASVSPWAIGAPREGGGGTALGVAAIAWLVLTSIAASALGGYLAGRLRARWSVGADEAWFRDTAHGLVAWSVATLVTAATLTSAIGGILGTAGKAGSAAAAAAVAGATAVASGPAASDVTAYVSDQLFRRSAQGPAAAASGSSAAASSPGGSADGTATADANAGRTQPEDPAERAEAGRILAQAMSTGSLPAEDAAYLGTLVQRRTGLAATDAEKRVTDTFARAQRAAATAATEAKRIADEARKAAAGAALWMFVALLGGAFFAAWLAAWGGRHRDRLS